MKIFISLVLCLLTAITPAFCASANKPKSGKSVMLAILARNKAHVLPRYLQCIDSLDYDKKLITVYINTNNNEDTTEKILKAWAKKNKAEYKQIIFEAHDVKDLPSSRPHEWNADRFKVLGAIRQASLEKAKELGCEFYFVVDCDNFIIPETLKDLVSKNKPIIAPLLYSIPEKNDPYSNYFSAADARGYWVDHPDYWRIFKRELVGTFLAPVVHCTYLVRTKFADKLTYIDETNDYEFIVFSRSARQADVHQYICNQKEYGVMAHFHDDVSIDEENRRLQEFFDSH